jgi:NAD kinase
MGKMIIKHDMELDRKVERYFRKPVMLNDIVEYSIQRDTSGTTMLTLKIYVDPERFEQEEGGQ